MAVSGTGYLDIADTLERQIMSGELQTNHKLPSTTAMAKDWLVSPLTIQRSLRRLADKGMVKRVPGRGTIVIANIRSDVLGLLFGTDISGLPSRFYLSLLSGFQKLSSDYGLQTQEYVVFDERATFRSLSALETDAREGRLRCFIPVHFSDQVGSWLHKSNILPFVSLPDPDPQKATQGLIHLIRQGYKRIAFMSMIEKEEDKDYVRQLRSREEESIVLACQETGFNPENIKYIRSVDGESEAYEITAKLLKEGEYDAFFIEHDLVLRGSVMALLQSGKRIGPDIGLLSTLNKGSDIFLPFGLSHFLLDPDDIVRNCLDYLTSSNTILKPGENKCPVRVKASFIPSESTMRG